MAERANLGGKRGAKKNGAVGHNSKQKTATSGVVSDEVYQRWMKKIEVAQAAVDRAAKPLKSRKGELSQIIGAAKDDGVDVDAIREAFKMDALDHLDVATKYANTGRVLRLMKSPLGEQMDLFRTVDLPIAVTAAIAGRRAGATGRPNENPHTPGSEPFAAYEDHYTRAQETLQDELR
jgi:hypothetical protein